MIRILIVDDQKSIREQLKNLLEQEPNLEVVGTAEDGSVACERVSDLRPDIVLIDVLMPGMDGLSATQVICQNYPQTKLIGWSSLESKDLVGQFLQVGGTGYLTKDTPIDELAVAIALVHKGYIQISPNLTNNTERNTATPAPIVQIERQITKGTIVPIEANELLPSVSTWTILGGLVTASAIAIATIMATVIQYKVVVKGNAIVRPAGELRLVQASTEGAVIGIFSKINQQVKKGDIIATLDSSQLQTQKIQLQTSIQQAQLQLTLIEAQINALESQIQAETDKIERNIASARAEYNLRLREYQDSQITTVTGVEEAQSNLKLAQDELSRYQQLVTSGVISELQLAEKQAAYSTAQARLKGVQTALNPSNAGVEIAEESIARQQATGKATLATLNKERQALIQQKIAIDKLLSSERSSLQRVELDLKKTHIVATANGIIAKLNLRNPGQTVKAGEEIAQIVPSNSAMEIKAQISPQDISKVRLEQPVDMRISACPYPDYGTLSGMVSKISPDAFSADRNNNMLPFVSSTKAVYEVTIAPDSLVLSQGSKQCSLQLGMEGRADIISNQETVWQFILRKARLTTNL